MTNLTPRLRFALIGDPQYADCHPQNTRDYHGSLKRHHELMDILAKDHLDFVVSLGDLGDGRSRDEIPAILDSYAKLSCPVYYVIGNHDYVCYSEAELFQLFGLTSFFYNFSQAGIRFIVLDGLDESRFRPDDDPRKLAADKFRQKNSGICFREWDGKISDHTLAELETQLLAAQTAGEQVILLCHIPVWHYASGVNAVLYNHQQVLALMDKFTHIIAYFAGHYHPGSIALRHGVLHKTVKALSDVKEATAIIAEIYDNKLVLQAIGEESDFVHTWNAQHRLEPVQITGVACPDAVIVSAEGTVTRCDALGNFVMTVPVAGNYCLKAMADNMADAFINLNTALTNNIVIHMHAELGRKVISGQTLEPATLHILDQQAPVVCFDLEGTYFGQAKDTANTWHEKTRNFWTAGQYAFSTTSPLDAISVNQVCTHHPTARQAGYYKGDFHAHIVHGENHYKVNPTLSLHIARAEHYDWLFVSQDYANDNYPVDWLAFAKENSLTTDNTQPKLLFCLNSEFPKNHYGHVGNIGAEPIFLKYDCEAVTNFELAKRYIFDCNAVTIPVHPFYSGNLKTDAHGVYSHMTFKELWLWLLCEPEMIPCLDLFYNDNAAIQITKFWCSLLDLGYRIGCAATSDAALDVGRSPGSDRGATYVKAEKLSTAAIVQAIRQRRTAVSWYGTLVTLQVDTAVSGDILPTSDQMRQVTINVYGQVGDELRINLISNSQLIKSWEVTIPGNASVAGEVVLNTTIIASDNSYYLVTATTISQPDLIRAAASPVYFRNQEFVAPAVYSFPSTITSDFKQWLKHLTLDELLNLDLRDETLNRLRALGAEIIIQPDNRGQ